jgi:hypothetical protein
VACSFGLPSMKNARDLLKVAALLVVASLAWNYALPGLVAYFDGTFYEAGIEAKLPGHDSAAISAYRNYKLEQERLRLLLLQTDQQIANIVSRGQWLVGRRRSAQKLAASGRECRTWRVPEKHSPGRQWSVAESHE